MSSFGPADRLRLAMHRAGRIGRQLNPVALAGRVSAWAVTRGTGVELLIAPPDIRTADPTVAADIAAGRFVFAGKSLDVGTRSPFAAEPPSEDWARALHAFAWLRHLRVADTADARARARTLVAEWLRRAGRPTGPAWETEVAATRLIAFLSQSPLILEGADYGFYRRFIRSLIGHALELRARLSALPPGIERLHTAIAIASAGLCIGGQERLLRSGLDRLEAELEAQVLPDGGHISRDPGQLGRIMADLLPFRQALIARGHAPSTRLMGAAERILPMMRFFRHGDGSFARFNGMTASARDLTATILAYDETLGRPVMSALYSGYERVEAGKSLLLVDAGGPPPIAYSRRAHAGTLSFEFSHGRQRIVVNCGAPSASYPRLSFAARQTAAHSTATLNDLSSSRFSGPEADAEIVSGPRAVKRERSVSEDGATVLELAHDGYLKRIGMSHERRLALSADGLVLSGEDRFPGATRLAGQTFTLRFHLHPNIEPERQADGILLGLPDGSAWTFSADQPVIIEESVFFSDTRGTRPTLQLLIAGKAHEVPQVAWRLARL